MARELVTPEQFGSYEPPARIIGCETEIDMHRPNGSQDPWPDGLVTNERLGRMGLSAFGPGEGASKQWLTNGSHMYNDAGNFEVCAAESLGPAEAVAALHAGHHVIGALVEDFGNGYSAFNRSAGVGTTDTEYSNSSIANKRGAVVTKGFHTNFCVPEEILPVLPVLETHLATQGLYASGGLATVDDGFNIAPKSYGIGKRIVTDLNDRTKEHRKPMGIARWGSFERADKEMPDNDVSHPAHGFGRFEDRTKTPSSQWSDFMGMATTSLLLRVLEHPELQAENHALRALELGDPVATFKKIGTDIAMQEKYPFRAGHTKSAIEIQAQLANIAAAAADKLDLPQDEVFALEQWLQVCTDLRDVATGNAEIRSLMERIGWVAKYQYLLRSEGADAIAAATDRVLYKCLMWHQLGPKPGIGQAFHAKLVKAQSDAVIASPETIAHYMQHPPEGTRAAARAESVKNLLEFYRTRRYTWPGLPSFGLQWSNARDLSNLKLPDHLFHPYDPQAILEPEQLFRAYTTQSA